MTLRLFVASPPLAGSELTLPPGAARHAQVRRVRPGDTLWLFDGSGFEWLAEVAAIGRSEVRVRVGAPVAVDKELRWPVTIALAVPANERMDLLVEKAGELGAAMIQPLVTERSVLRLEGERAARRREHWQAVAEAASEQCGRARVAQVAPVRRLHEWLPTVGPGMTAPSPGCRADRAERDPPGHAPPGCLWLLSLQASAASLPAPGSIPAGTPITTLSGPEGGLAGDEEAAAVARGFSAIALGPRVLRADTAPLAVLAFLALQAVG